MVIPVGRRAARICCVIEKARRRDIEKRGVLPVRFVPMTGKGVDDGRR